MIISARYGTIGGANVGNSPAASFAQSKGFSFQELQKRLTINLKPEPFKEDGYRWDPQLKFSIQGFDAKKAADNLYRLARLLNEELWVRLY